MGRSNSERHKEYRFGDFRLIPDRQLLLHGETILRIGSRGFDLLHLLVSRAGEVVSKDDLTDFAWPSTHIHESNLKVNIAALRRALPRAPSEPPLIATVPGRGYRFAAPVRVLVGTNGVIVPEEVRKQSGELPSSPEMLGRDDVVSDLEEKIFAGSSVTIVGPAGVGKTTVAVAAARRFEDRFADGVHFVDLSVLDDAQLVGPAIASALGIGGDFTNILAALAQALAGRDMLLLLDNCEHVLTVTASILEYLQAAVPTICFLATSREPLRYRGETVLRLATLACPAPDSEVDASEAITYPAVQLFVRKAQEAYGYWLDDADAPIVAEICRRLDGIALAIELAVARLSTCDPATLLRALEQSYAPLNLDSGEGAARQRTLLATLEWSYKLLSEDDARQFRMLSVFTGTFSFDDIMGITGDADGPAESIAARVEGLVSKSLLTVAYQSGGLRYRLLDSTRSYAAEALRQRGEVDQVLIRFARHLLKSFECAEAEWQWRAREDWTRSYAPRATDLRKAIDWAFGPCGDPLVGVRLTAAAIPFWDELSIVAESRLRVKRALESDALDQCSQELKMKLMASYASGLNFSDHLGREANAAWNEAYRLAVAIGNVDYQLRTLWGLAVLQSFSGRHREALATLDRFRTLARRENERSALPDGERLRLMTGFYCGDIRQASEGLETLEQEQGADIARVRVARFQIDRSVGIQVALSLTRWMKGDHRGAMATVEGALGRATGLGHLVSQSNALAQSALPLALFIGDLPLARHYAAMLTSNLNLRDIAIWEPVSKFFNGAVASVEDDPASIYVMHMAIEQLIRNNFLIRVPLYLAMTAEAALKFNRMEVARRSITMAVERAELQGEHWCEPELLRVRGLLQWHEGDLLGAERLLRAAVRNAQQSDAMSFQLRASTVLADLLMELGRQAEARSLLTPVYGKFDPDFRGHDVDRAGALLAKMKSGDN